MAGSVRFESSSASPEDLPFSGGYPNGQRGNYSFDRSGSFREGSEGRIFGSASSMSRGISTSTGDAPLVLQCLPLDPITMGDQKYPRLLGEIRRVLGISFGTTVEDNSFGAAHSKPPPPVATEDLKRFKSSVSDSIIKARGRVKRLEDSIHKLTKYCESSNSKKQQRNEMLTNERSGGLNLLKGTLMQRNSPDLLTQRLEDRTKNIVLNKRVRSSVAETRAEGRTNIPARQPHSMVKDRDMLKDGGDVSDLVEEKIRRLPAGGEGWDKKMKRKRSVGTVFTRPVDNDGELKRVMHHKLNNEPGLPPCDAQSFRSSSSGANGINKSDNTSLPAGSNVRSIPKNDLEKVTLSRDPMAGSTKERIKGTNKLNIREDNHIVSPGPFTKGKASRAPRTGPVMAANSSPNIPRPSGADGWEQPPSINKVNSVGGANNRKRPMPAGSSSPPMAQWVGQRPQKMSRTRRANLVSPVSNLDEGQMSSEGCTTDLGARITMGTNGSLTARGVANGTQQFRVKQENVTSPARLSEIEESGAGENRESRLKEKGIVSNEVEERATSAAQSVGSSVLLAKKNKILIKEESVDGVQRQGRSGRGSSYSRTSISPLREKLENQSSSKPLKSTRPGSDKSGSKSGRPPIKKLSERKVFSRVVHTSINGSPDFSGELEDDHEDILAAANFACNSSYLACSGSFWKKMEPLFASVSLEDISNLKQQLKSTDEYHESLSQICDRGNDVMGDLVHGEDFLPYTLVSGEKERSLLDQFQEKGPARMLDLGDQIQANGDFVGRLDSDSKNEDTPLYQRVLSALIAEDETEEFEENSGGRYTYSRDDFPGSTSLLIDAESRKRDRIQYDSMLGQVQKQCSFDGLSCNGNTTFNRGRSIQNVYNDDFSNGGSGLMHGETRIFSEFSENAGNGTRAAVHTSASSISSLDCQYEQMCLRDKLMSELQSIGLYLESVPDLADQEDETINQDIVELQKAHLQQVGKKKEHLNKILKAIEEAKEREERDLEQVAMNRLVELAYKKKLATRGSSASKSGVAKVSKQVAMAFMKRTLARCLKFEETGKSCFTEPAIRDVIFATPPRANDAESTKSHGLVSRSSVPVRAEQRDLHEDKFDRGSFDAFRTRTLSNDQDFIKTGPIFNRGRKKEVLLDDVGGSASLRAASAIGNTSIGGAKGKRSERERDKDMAIRNSAAKPGRASMGNAKGERKMKSKPKQKIAQLSTSGNGFSDKFAEATPSLHSSANISKEVVNNGVNKKTDGEEVKEPFDIMEQLGEHQDLSNFLSNLNEDEELGDNDLMGLEIPMDDLSELNMF
ncbi:hypothetical protein QYF36_005437 [Acer negundo]|nr:hypothetical protein QYF36_005437 [Acer negundo]